MPDTRTPELELPHQPISAIGSRLPASASAQAAPASRSGTPPLLTIAIPTWNRAGHLAELLDILLPQIPASPAGDPVVELLISDNGSTDGTQPLVRRHIAAGAPIRYHRHPENIGSDANFVSCFSMARGTYFWLFSDDDIIVPGALSALLPHLSGAPFDLIYATSYPFREDWRAERQGDPLGRCFHTISSARQLARVANVMFTFISGMVVNKARLEALRAVDPTIEPPASFIGTNLTQLSWTLPLLRHHRRSLVLWERPVAGRQGNAGGYSLGEVFGDRLRAISARCLPDRPDLARIITNFAIRRWFPSVFVDLRSAGNQTFSLEHVESALRRSYSRNPRFWIFTWPVLRLPLPLARLWARAGAALSKLIYVIEIPTFFRKRS